MIKKKYQEEIKSGKLPKTPILYIMIVRTNKNPNKNAQLMRSPTQTSNPSNEEFTVLIQTEKTADYYKNITE